MALKDKILNLVKGRRLSITTFGLSCCAVEVMNATKGQYNLKNLNVKFTPNINKANVLIIAGTLNNKMSAKLKGLYDEMQKPCWVISMGSCANSGGAYTPSYSVVNGVDKIIPVDIYVPGCPPTPDAVLYALTQLRKKIKAGR